MSRPERRPPGCGGWIARLVVLVFGAWLGMTLLLPILLVLPRAAADALFEDAFTVGRMAFPWLLLTQLTAAALGAWSLRAALDGWLNRT